MSRRPSREYSDDELLTRSRAKRLRRSSTHPLESDTGQGHGRKSDSLDASSQQNESERPALELEGTRAGSTNTVPDVPAPNTPVLPAFEIGQTSEQRPASLEGHTGESAHASLDNQTEVAQGRAVDLTAPSLPNQQEGATPDAAIDLGNDEDAEDHSSSESDVYAISDQGDVEPIPSSANHGDNETKDAGKLSSFQCSICFESPENLAATPCGHLFCDYCIRSALTADTRGGHCPICRHKISMKQVLPLSMKVVN